MFPGRAGHWAASPIGLSICSGIPQGGPWRAQSLPETGPRRRVPPRPESSSPRRRGSSLLRRQTTRSAVRSTRRRNAGSPARARITTAPSRSCAPTKGRTGSRRASASSRTIRSSMPCFSSAPTASKRSRPKPLRSKAHLPLSRSSDAPARGRSGAQYHVGPVEGTPHQQSPTRHNRNRLCRNRHQRPAHAEALRLQLLSQGRRDTLDELQPIHRAPGNMLREQAGFA